MWRMFQGFPNSNFGFWLFLAMMFVGLAGCGSSGGGSDDDDDDDGGIVDTGFTTTAARNSPILPGDVDCPNGGILVETGVDDNENGVLDDGEVDSANKVCNGGDGLSALITQSAEAAGANCTFGGVRIDMGVDVDASDTLEPGEVTDSTYLCNASGISATRNSVIAAGDADCPDGGVLVESGIDDNNNGVLDNPEIDSSNKICNGGNGLNALISQADEPEGANCTLGGVRLDVGLDLNGNDILDAGEITDTSYVCNPAGPSAGNANGWEQIDDWGDAWDGVERFPANWADADAECQALGGRLPTMTELYRVSAAQAGNVGNVYTTSRLWSQTWWTRDFFVKGTVRLTDGDTNFSDINNLEGYRCIWPASDNTFFAGNKCFGPPGSACWTTVGDRGQMNMDLYERPEVPFTAAHEECNFVNAHLAHLKDFVENVRAGLPNGSNSWLWAADAARYDRNYVTRWTDTDTAYTGYDSTYQSVGTRNSGNFRFRCKGVNSALGAHPNPVPDEFLASGPHIKGSAASVTPLVYAEAVDACTAQGGHVAHPRDIFEMASVGMPNGPGTGGSDHIWLSDHTRYDTVQITRWGGIDETFNDWFSEHSTWALVDLVTTRQYRCAYYPLDPGYTAPADAQCAGGTACFQASFGSGAQTVEYAMDSIDRSAVTYPEAVDDCVADGGRLANSLQLTEMIRAGLPNGSDASLWTGDSASGDTDLRAFSKVFRWTGVNTAFSPVYAGAATYIAKAAQEQPYRCIWSNELW